MLKLQFKDRRQEAVWLVDPGITVGRDRISGLVIDEAGVSGFHADIRVSGEDVVIESVGADSAIVVNGERITEPTSLQPGDQVDIGSAELLVVDPKDMTSQDPAEMAPAPSAESVLPLAELPDALAGAGDGQGDPVGTAGQQLESDWALRAETGPLAGKLFPVIGETVLGRALQCGISIPEARLSREHAKLTVQGDELVVTDLGSSNGTFHNGERISESRPRHGDALAFDSLRFKVIGPANNLDKTVISMAPARVAGAAGTTVGHSGSAADADADGAGGVPAWVWLLAVVLIAGGAALMLL